ncbi:putative quinol monooxygenase [Williamsia sp.]|uniref:putative quinol monooxygenase n=1 Tax=Williamsia sp. TaxID=1872085 RepID=UPI002F941216
MAKTAMVGTMSCVPGKSVEFEAALDGMVEAAAAEPGVEIYSYHRGDNGTYWFFALMEDENAMQIHGRTAAMQTATAAIGPLMSGPPRMNAVSPIAAVGFTV